MPEESKSGLEQARAKAAQLKAESTAAKEGTEGNKEQALETLKEQKLAVVEVQGIEVTSEVADLYKATSQLGMENVGGQSLPQLKVMESNSKDVLFDGSKPKEGTFFYQPTKEIFEHVLCSIVTISRGFYTIQRKPDGSMPRKDDGDADTKFNQLVGGILLDGTLRPFIMFASGTRWKGMNDFAKSIHPLTKHKTMPIPMYAFQVDLMTHKQKTQYGENHVIDYNLVKKDGKAQLVTDKSIVEALLTASSALNDMFESFIAAREVNRYSGELVADAPKNINVTQVEQPAQAVEVDPQIQATYNQVANPDEVMEAEDVADDIPF